MLYLVEVERRMTSAGRAMPAAARQAAHAARAATGALSNARGRCFGFVNCTARAGPSNEEVSPEGARAEALCLEGRAEAEHCGADDFMDRASGGIAINGLLQHHRRVSLPLVRAEDVLAAGGRLEVRDRHLGSEALSTACMTLSTAPRGEGAPPAEARREARRAARRAARRHGRRTQRAGRRTRALHARATSRASTRTIVSCPSSIRSRSMQLARPASTCTRPPFTTRQQSSWS